MRRGSSTRRTLDPMSRARVMPARYPEPAVACVGSAGGRLPAAAQPIADVFVGVAALTLGPYRWLEHVAVELAAHTVHDLVVEQLVGLRLAAEDSPLAAAPTLLLFLAGLGLVLQAAELAGRDHLCHPQAIALGLIGG